MQDLHIAGSDEPVGFYSLDVIISVGYRVKSLHGTQFRIWATRVLRDHLVQGYRADRIMQNESTLTPLPLHIELGDLYFHSRKRIGCTATHS